jgi:hypothetical protein
MEGVRKTIRLATYGIHCVEVGLPRLVQGWREVGVWVRTSARQLLRAQEVGTVVVIITTIAAILILVIRPTRRPWPICWASWSAGRRWTMKAARC